MNISLSNLIFGVLPFFILIFEAWIIRGGFATADGERFPRIIYLFAFILGLIPIFNFAMSIIFAGVIICTAFDSGSSFKLRKEKGFLYWLFRRD